MTDSSSRLEQFFERAAALGATPPLHPSKLFEAVDEAARASVRDGAIANVYRVTVSRSDAAVLRAHEAEFVAEACSLLDRVAANLGATPPGPWSVECVTGPSVAPGAVIVSATFRNPRSETSPTALIGATQLIHRLHGKYLVVDGFGRVALTHAPFLIGRGHDCDLSIPDLAISRRHARVELLPSGDLVLRDLGSRNLLTVAGRKVADCALTPGERVQIGGTTIWLEDSE